MLHSLEESIKEFVECQRQLLQFNGHSRSNEDHHQSLEVEEGYRILDMREQCADRRFRRRAELSDLVRKYRKFNEELNPNADEKSRRLLDFYVSEGREIEQEIQFLDSNNNKD